MAPTESVIIFDTTLRDGEQALQASLSVKEKLQIALALERLGVDIMEVGFPVSSPGDFNSVQTIAKTVKNSTVCALARCVTGDIDAAIAAIAPAQQKRVHIFLATSTLHIEAKFRKNFTDIMAMAVGSIKHARNYCDDIEFSCEDAGRTPIDNLCRIVEAAITAGAKTINIPDTVGYTTPEQFSGIIYQLKQRIPNIDQAILSVHCHDDLGMSVANSLSAIQAGARQVEGTINGIGERAGNCALEEVIMALKTRADLFQVTTRINHQEIYRTSQLVSQLCNMPVPANKAIIGKNAFAHSSGIHQDGVLKNKQTYEIMTPESVGLPPITLNLTSRSGRAAVKHRMQEMGYNDNDYDLDRLYKSFLQLADRKGQIFDYDLEALAFISNQHSEFDYFQLDYLNMQTNQQTFATATITLLCGEQACTEAATGNGPIDAIYQAIARIVPYSIKLISYQLTAKGTDPNALGQADIIAEYQHRRFHGIGLATDIIEASAAALIHVLNSVWRAEQVQKQRRLAPLQ